MFNFSRITCYLYSLVPDALIKRVLLDRAKLRQFTLNTDIKKTKKRILLALIITLGSLLAFIILGLNVSLSIILSFCLLVLAIFVLTGAVRSQIIKRYKNFDERGYIILNSISVALLIHQSIFYSIDLLLRKNSGSNQYSLHFQELLLDANFGESENQLLKNFSKSFLSKEYAIVLENLSNGRYIESNPLFLTQIKREIGIIEDNIVLFIALSCLFPLSLSMVIPLLVTPNSPLVLLFPLLFGLFGALFLRYVQNKSYGDIHV